MIEKTDQELRESLSVTIKRGIAVLVLLIVSSIAYQFPDTDVLLFRRFQLIIFLRLGIGATIAIILLSLYSPLTYLVRYYVRAVFWKNRGEAEFESAVTTITVDVVSLAYVCILYWAVVPSLSSMLWIIFWTRWPKTVLQLSAVAIAVVLSVRLFKHAAPLVSKASEALADKAAEATLAATTSVCPKCRAQNEKGSRFCRSCGGQITQAARIPERTKIELKCPKCGAVLEHGSKFCGSCGRNLGASSI